MTTEILIGIIIALISGICGNIIGTRNIVGRYNCTQLRSSCQALLIEKIENIEEKVENLTKAINSKLLGI